MSTIHFQKQHVFFRNTDLVPFLVCDSWADFLACDSWAAGSQQPAAVSVRRGGTERVEKGVDVRKADGVAPVSQRALTSLAHAAATSTGYLAERPARVNAQRHLNYVLRSVCAAILHLESLKRPISWRFSPARIVSVVQGKVKRTFLARMILVMQGNGNSRLLQA
jgi:hypothetical protein